MKCRTLAVLAIGLLWVGSAAAFEPAGMVYYRIPLDGKDREESKPVFGFKLDRSRTNPEDYLNKRGVMDLQMNDDGLRSWRLWGWRIKRPPAPGR